MSLRKVSNGALLFSAVLLTFTSLLSTEAQDVDVPGNLTMRDSTGPTVGNVLKGGVSFIHNFGDRNTFIGSNAGNLTMVGPANTAMGVNARFTPISTPMGANWVQSKTTFRPTCSVLEGGADNFLSVKEAATRLGLCPASIYKMCQHGELPHIRVLNSNRSCRPGCFHLCPPHKVLGHYGCAATPSLAAFHGPCRDCDPARPC